MRRVRRVHTERPDQGPGVDLVFEVRIPGAPEPWDEAVIPNATRGDLKRLRREIDRYLRKGLRVTGMLGRLERKWQKEE